MPVIDADTHVDETEFTWEFMQPDEQEMRPVTEFPANPDPSRFPARYWRIDGRRCDWRSSTTSRPLWIWMRERGCGA